LKIKLTFLGLVLAIVVFVSACASTVTDDDTFDSVAGIPEVLHALQNPDDWVILDVRTRAEYEGVDAGTMGVFGFGRIAGAVHIEWSEAVDAAGQLLPEVELLELYSEVLDGRSIIVYCRSGARSSHTLAVLNDLGADVLNFEGSWIEWSYAASASSSFPDRDLVLSFTEAWTDIAPLLP